VGGIPDVVEDGVEGYIVEPGDEEALADRLVRLINDPERRGRKGQSAQDKRRPFHWGGGLSQLENEVRQSIEGRGASQVNGENAGRVLPCSENPPFKTETTHKLGD